MKAEAEVMHCPKCGFQVDSGEVNFCTRCGLTLGGIRTAMSADVLARPGTPRKTAVNLGVVLMFIGTLPALAAVLTASFALPAAFLTVLVAFGLIVFGSGPLMRAFRTDGALVTDAAAHSFRKEIAFGAMLMFFAMLVAVFLWSVVPDSAGKAALLILSPLMLAATLLLSRPVFNSVQRAFDTEHSAALRSSSLEQPQSDDYHAATTNLLNVPTHMDTADLSTPGVTEDTTRQFEMSAEAGKGDRCSSRGDQ